MRLKRNAHWLWVIGLSLVTTCLTGCDKSRVSSAAASESSGKLPISTKSEQARQEFLKGRDMSDRLLAHESLEQFDKAIADDPDFASAELARANSSATTKDFFDHLNKAVSLADKVSEGEKLLILANQAAANGDTTKQKDYLEKLLVQYPNDERAQFNLGVYCFGQQDMDEAVDHFKRTIALDPNYSPVYNMIGYAYRQQGNYSGAEQAFKKYVELLPNDPNPYDSYGELLLKMGRFEDSLTQYHKALSIDPDFQSSHFGISADLMYENKPDQANAELQKMADQARNDGELRTALFGMAVVASDSGKFEKALQAMDREYVVAEKKKDVTSMGADLQAKGNILVEMARLDEAQKAFDRSFQMIESSDLSQQIKDNAKLLHVFNQSALAMDRKDNATAKARAEEFRQGAEASKNQVQIRLAHELAGRIALAEKDYDKAIAELEQSNQQDPRNLYRLSQAYQGKGDDDKAHEWCAKAADFNSLPALNYAFIRVKAQKQEGKKA
jgi:tetratricopeptide (TPR) repeat protein